MKKLRLTLPILAAFAIGLAGCNYNSYVYRIDVPQGNLVTQEMAEQLTLGMSRAQVQFLIGEPLVKSDFHLNRWDYVYYFNPRHGNVELRKMTIFFGDDGRVEKIEKDPLPTEREADATILGTLQDLKKNTKE